MSQEKLNKEIKEIIDNFKQYEFFNQNPTDFLAFVLDAAKIKNIQKAYDNLAFEFFCVQARSNSLKDSLENLDFYASNPSDNSDIPNKEESKEFALAIDWLLKNKKDFIFSLPFVETSDIYKSKFSLSANMPKEILSVDVYGDSFEAKIIAMPDNVKKLFVKELPETYDPSGEFTIESKIMVGPKDVPEEDIDYYDDFCQDFATKDVINNPDIIEIKHDQPELHKEDKDNLYGFYIRVFADFNKKEIWDSSHLFDIVVQPYMSQKEFNTKILKQISNIIKGFVKTKCLEPKIYELNPQVVQTLFEKLLKTEGLTTKQVILEI